MYFFRSAALIQQVFGKSATEISLYTENYRAALLRDFRDLPPEPAAADALFAQHAFPLTLAHSPSAQVEAWEYVLALLQADDDVRYRSLHKGTPFYFLGVASYLSRDFEKALFYMDAALEEDLRLDNDRWPLRPAGKFVLLDDDSPEQFARPLVARTREEFNDVMATVASLGGTGLSIDELRAKLVRPAMTVGSGKRSAVTGFLSFLLEYASRTKELSLAGTETSTGEPFFLHLFKGGLLFETLLKSSTVGRAILTTSPKATIDQLLREPAVYSSFGFNNVPQGLGGDTFDDVLVAIASDSDGDFNQRAVRATWGIRNKTGHSMAWPRRPSLDEYKKVFHLIAGALSATLDKLHA